MNIRLNSVLLYVMLLSPLGLVAQRTHSFSAGLGTLYYYGDLTDQFNNALVRPAGTISYSRYFLSNLRFRASLSYGELGASDGDANAPGRTLRNLHFRSHLAEVSGVLIYEFLRDKNFGNSWQGKPHLSPYVFGGVALFNFNPKARFDGEWYELQPLGTEGQYIPGGNGPEAYSLIQFSAPVGIGINVRLSEYTGFSFEIGYRTTATDYIDDISTVYPDFDALAQTPNGSLAVELSERSLEGLFQPGDTRGNPGSNDSYFFTVFSIDYYLSRYASRD
ncbi:MAG: DUF6089 family protein [Bacteroidota bacterium]